MINLLICETKKYKNTYIILLALLGMISPVILMAIAFTVARQDFIASDSYTWYKFSSYVVEAFVFLLGPLITSFISISSVFYEYQCKTMKNILTTTYSRTQIIIAKMIYISMLVIGLYLCVAIADVACGFILGFDITIKEIIKYTGYFLLSGLATIVIVPLSMLLTLIFKSFIPPMVISVAGIIPNMSAYQWDKCYLSPWAAPEVLILTKAEFMKINILYPTITTIVYFILFLISMIIFFRHADQHC